MKIKSKIVILIIIFFILFIFTIYFTPKKVYAANLEIPILINIMKYEPNVGINDYFYTELSISGGIKYNIFVSFYYLSNISPTFTLLSIYAQIKDDINFFTFSIFHGLYKKLLEGPEIFDPFLTANFLTTSSTDNFQYNYFIHGNGGDLSFNFLDGKIFLSLILYQRTLSPTNYSIDLYSKISLAENLTIELFTGTDYFQTYRAGLLIYFHEEFFKFKINIGHQDILSYRDFYDLYLSFEQFVELEQFSQSFIIFSKPYKYNQVTIHDYLDLFFSLRIAYNNIYKTFYLGTIAKILLSGFSIGNLEIIPYINLLNGGILFKIATTFDLLNPINYLKNITILIETSF
jgi:hypothetical protein